MRLSVVKRGSKWHLDGYISRKRFRISLGTANESHATDIKRRIENAIARENESQFWPELCRLLPPQSFRALAELANYREPKAETPPTWRDLRSAFTMRMSQQRALGKMAESTRQRYEYTLKSFQEFLNLRRLDEIRDLKRPFIESFKVWRRAKIMEKKFSRNGRGLALDIAILHSVFAVAVEDEMILANPVRMEGRPGDNLEVGAQPFDGEAQKAPQICGARYAGVSPFTLDRAARIGCR
jgi:hypothetical protein